MHGQIRVLILDDQTIFRESLARALSMEPEIALAGSFGTIREALDAIAREQVDVVLLDYDLGAERGTSFLGDARQMGFRGAVAVLTAGVTRQVAAELIRQGVVSLLSKSATLPEVVEAVKTAARGIVSIDERQFREAVAQPAPAERFSDRERKVVAYVMQGLTNKEIGVKIGLSEASVKAALQRLFAIMGVRTRSQLVCALLETGAPSTEPR